MELTRTTETCEDCYESPAGVCQFHVALSVIPRGDSRGMYAYCSWCEGTIKPGRPYKQDVHEGKTRYFHNSCAFNFLNELFADLP